MIVMIRSREPAIHSQSLVLNARTKGFPLLSGLGIRFRTTKSTI